MNGRELLPRQDTARLTDAASLLEHGQYRAAQFLLMKGFMLEPSGSLFGPLADLCRLQQDWPALERVTRQRLGSNPDDTWAWYHLACCSLQQRHYHGAIEQLREALCRNPVFLEAWLELGNLWKELGEVGRALVCYRHAVRSAPDCARAQDNLLFAQLFSDCHPPELLAAAHRSWGQHQAICPPITTVPPGSRLKVAYLSPDLREHSVAGFLEPLLQHHDRSRFEIFCYQCNQQEDAVTARLRSYADQWRNISALGDAEAEALIRQDGVHLLVDLAGHTAGNRLGLLGRRPAPLQATWLGYPHSTGLPAISFRITDATADPAGEADGWHSERLVRLPAPFLCYGPPEDAPPVTPLPPVAQAGRLTLACFNRIDKISPLLFEIWRGMLERLPQARLLLKSGTFADPWVRERFVARSGLPADRLELLARTPDRRSHLALYSHADIALDTFPYNGTTTTCEALWMGVPVVTLVGRHHAARVGKTLLEAVGLDDLATDSPEAYCDRVCALAQDSTGLSHLRQNLRSRVHASPLCNAVRFARNIEDAYRLMAASLSA